MRTYFLFLLTIVYISSIIIESLNFDSKYFLSTNKVGSYYNLLLLLIFSVVLVCTGVFDMKNRFTKNTFIILGIAMFTQFLKELSIFVNAIILLWYKFLDIISLVQIIYIVLLIYTIFLLILYMRSNKKEELID